MSTERSLHIRSAADLLKSLREGDAGVRLPLIAGIVANPQRVLAYGKHDGLDVIDELIRQLSSQPGIYEKALMGALCAFDDRRMTEYCQRVARESSDAEMVTLAMKFVDEHSVLLELLSSDEPIRAVPAARALRSHEQLALEHRMKVELWVGLPTPLEVAPDTLEIWLQALHGPLSRRARTCLEAAGAPALRLLDPFWESWPLELRRWYAEWGLGHPAAAPDLLLKALSFDELVEIALPHVGSESAVLASKFLTHAKPSVRAKAWLVADLPPCPEKALSLETTVEVRRAVATRLVQDGIAPLTVLAQDEDWQVRALAAQGMIRLGSESLEPARQLAQSENPEIRAVGVRVLMSLEDYEWMEETLL